MEARLLGVHGEGATSQRPGTAVGAVALLLVTPVLIDAVKLASRAGNIHVVHWRIVLDVAEFNERAICVYERAGFHRTARKIRFFEAWGDIPFVDMERPA
jgi:hypothetical protein